MIARHLCILFVLCVSPQSVVGQVDFARDVVPILKRHCYDCHAGENREGDLLLDSIKNIEQGGHTGNPLFSTSLADSELYLRISSTSDGYRMPKRGEPLSSEEIKTISTWIRERGELKKSERPEPTAEVPPKKATKTTAVIPKPAPPKDSEKETRQQDRSEPAADNSPITITKQAPPTIESRGLPMTLSSDQILIIVAGVALAFLALWLLSGGGKRKDDSDSFDEPWLGRTPSSLGWTLVGLYNTLLLLGFLYYYDRCGRLTLENLRLQKSTPTTAIGSVPPTIVSEDSLPLPPHPMHPPRLGGKYYRGNDERDETLFNNGFYQTATIELHLVDSSGSRLKWGDDADSAKAIEITIERAPNATRELFTERVLKSVFIEHFCQTDPSVRESLTFDVIEKEQSWKALVSIPDASHWPSEKMQGMIYLMYGVQPGDPPTPRPHFGIRYDLSKENSTIGRSSELWMGSLYTLGGRVLVPNEKQVLLDRWFDWRPMPVIEGKGSDDPKLLGLPEHASNQIH